jgi:hypothetical protein
MDMKIPGTVMSSGIYTDSAPTSSSEIQYLIGRLTDKDILLGAEYISLLFTDLGVLTPAAVSDELIQLYV